MKVCVLFVLAFCVNSSLQQLNRKQPDPSSLSYGEAEFNLLPPIAKTTTTTEAPEETTKKKKGFFSGFTGLFKSKDKETTTIAPETSTAKKVVATSSTTTTTTTQKSVPLTPSTVKSVPVQPSTPKSVVPNVVSTPRVPPRSDSPTPPPRPSYQQPTTSTEAPKKAVKDDFPALPSQPTPRPVQQEPTTIKNAWGALPTGPTPKPFLGLPQTPPPNAWGILPTGTTAKPGAPNAWGPPPNGSTAKPAAPNAWGTPSTGPTQKPAWGVPQTPAPNAWGLPATGPTPKPPKFSPQTPTVTQQATVSSGPVTDSELLTLSESLFSKDIYNGFKFVTVNYQGKNQYGSSNDEAPQALLKIDEKLFALSTVEKMKVMYNNYEQDTSINEYVSPIERKEEDEFLDAVLATPVMRHAMNFLTQKGVVTSDPQTHRDVLKTIWFGLYSRGMGKISSSGFEHVFLSEIKNGTVMGLHNWIYLSEVEKSGDLDYKGWSKKIDLGNKGQIAKVRFSLNNLEKPSNSLFIGTSPELELAIYTVCFELRADQECRLAYGGKDFNIVTHSYKYRGKNMIGSAYPEI